MPPKQPARLSKKTRTRTIEAMHLAFDGETMKQLARALAESQGIMEYFLADLPPGDSKRPGLTGAIDQSKAALKRYREGKPMQHKERR